MKSYPRNFFRYLACLLLVLGAAIGTARAQPNVSCNTQQQTIALIRNEGATEQIGDYVFQCLNTGSQTTITVSATIASNAGVSIASKVLNGTTTEAALQIFTPAPIGGVSSTATYLGTTSSGVVTFSGVPLPQSVSVSSYVPFTLTITNIRVNAAENALGDSFSESVSVSGTGVTPVTFNATPVALVEQGLGAQSITGVFNPPVCSSFNATGPVFTAHFGEGAATPAAFKKQGGTGNSTIGSWEPANNNTETGFSVSSGSTSNTANSGTRVRLLIQNIPQNVAVYVPISLGSDQAINNGPPGTLTLTATESGAFSAVQAASPQPAGYTAPSQLAMLTVSNGQAEAVYEVTADSATTVETYGVPVYMVSTGTVAMSGAVTANVSFAPVAATSNIPNFAQLTASSPNLMGNSFPNCISLPASGLAAAFQNAAYSQSLAASGGTPPYSYMVTGTLPGTIALNAGTLAGNPGSATTGGYGFTVQATDHQGAITSHLYTLQLYAPMSVQTTSLASSDQGQGVTYYLQYAGGSGSGISWMQTGGSLPSGVSLNSSGVLTGTPTQNGAFTFTVKVTDSLNDMATGSVTWTVNPPLSITSTLLPAGQQNSPYSATLTAAGGSGTGYQFVVIGNNALPTTLDLSIGGVISGTPTARATYSIQIQVTDSAGGTASQTFTINIDAAGSIISTNLPAGDVIVNTSGTEYGADTYSGPNQIYWQLPFTADGKSLLEYTIQPGTYTFRVIDPTDAAAAFPSLTTPQLNSMYAAWTYNSPWIEATLVYSAAAIGNSSMNQLFSVAENSTAGSNAQQAYNYSISQGTFNQLFVGARNANPVLSYTFATTTTLVFAVPDNGLYDNGGGTSILIAPATTMPPSITTSSLSSGIAGSAYGPVTLTASGGSGYYTWAATGLPTGLMLSATGMLSGTVTTANTYTGISITVTDAVSGLTASQTYSLTIGPAFAITPASLPNGTFRQPYTFTLTASGASGNSANYSWSATGLPSWATLSTAGVLSGTATAGGITNGIMITVRDTSTSQTAAATFSLVINYVPATFNYISTVDGLAPLGYFRLEATSGTSEVNGYTYSSLANVTVQGGAPLAYITQATDNALSFDGSSQAQVNTSLSGGITTAGTLLAWVNLSELPSTAGRLLYIMGESQVGNDFDFQFSSDNVLRFYTTNNGQNISYTPDPTTLVGQWHMVAATFDNNAGKRAIYMDGVQVATDSAGSFANKTSAFTIGGSSVFTGRNFFGAIDEPAIWNSALSAQQIAQIYAIRSGSTYGSFPAGVNGVAYPPITLAATGGSGSFSWSATGMPAGMSLSSAGVLSGTPATGNTVYESTSYPRVSYYDNGTGTTYSISIRFDIMAPVSFFSTSIPTATSGVAYSQPIYYTGGIPPYTFSVTSGSLPPGSVFLNTSTGVIAGTPSLNGYPPNTAVTGSFTLMLTDFSGTTASQVISWVENPPLYISTTTPLPVGVQNDSYSQSLMAVGAVGSVTWSVAQGSTLPPGLMLSSAGALTGTLTQGGMFTFSVTATDSASNTATKQLSLTVNGVLTSNGGAIGNGALGEPYSASLGASGGLGTYTYGPILSGSLPPGVILSSTGALSGTPTSIGSYSFSVRVSDQNSDVVTSGNFTTTINGALTIGTTSLTAATQETFYMVYLSGSGGLGSYTWSETGALPAGVSLTSGVISGTPTVMGSFPITLKLADANINVMQMVTLVVNSGVLTITNTTLPSATNGTAYNQSIIITGGTPPYNATITSGTFTQAGLNLNSSNGAITGTPNTTGALAFSVQVTDNNNGTATQSYVLQISPVSAPSYDFAVANEGSSIVRVSDLTSRDATICPSSSCTSFDIVADAQGNIYTKNSSGIQKVTPGGVVTTVLNYSSTDSVLASSNGVGGITLDGLGNLIFVDNSADAIFRVKTDGTNFTMVAPYPTQSPSEAQDTYVAVDSSGNYIVVDDAFQEVAIYKFMPGGTTGTTVLDTPIAEAGVSGMAIDSAGNYDFLDWRRGQLVSVTPQGNVSTILSGISGEPLGLTIEHGTGNFIIGAAGSSSLARITPGGAVTGISSNNLIVRTNSIASIPAPSSGPLTISPSSLPGGGTNQTYGPITLTASGGSGSYQWTGSGFPQGISISTGGVISGVASSAGSYAVSVIATDSVTSQTGSASYTISITPSALPLSISQAGGQLDTAVGGSVSANFSVSGGVMPYTFSAAGLPSGVSINSSTGAISGNPSQAGTFSATVQVTDRQPVSASTQITIGALGMPSGSLAAGIAGQPYTASVSAVGGIGSITYSGSGLPAGLSVNSGGGVSGSVNTAGTYPFTVKATDSLGISSTGNFSVTFGTPGAIQIISSSLPSGSVGTSYGQSLSATGGRPPYQWSQSGGSLPAGLTLSSTGVVSGTPTAPGPFSFGVMVTDSAGGTGTATVNLNIQAAPLVITTASPLASGIGGLDYPMQVFNATGGTGKYTWSITSGALPPGITLSSGGTLQGNSSSTGSFAFTATVTDAASTKASANYTLSIRPSSTADLILSAGSVSFSVNTPSTAVPPSQNIGVQSSQPTTQLSYSLAVSPNATWLSLQNGALTPDTIQASLTQSALLLPAGSYSTTISITCGSGSCMGHTQSVSVSLTVTNAPSMLTVGTSLLSFGLSTASSVPATQTISIQNTGGGNLLLGSVSCEATWCSVSGVPASLPGGASGTISVTVDPVAAGAGFSRTQVDIVSSAGKASVAVNALVAANATMTLAPVGQQFSMQAGSNGPGNPNGSFLVTVANGNSVSWTASTSGADWLKLGVTSGTSTPGAPQAVTYSISPTQTVQMPGAYYGQIQVTSSNVVDSPQTFEVVLNVVPATAGVVPDPEPGGLLFITSAAATPPVQPITVYSGSAAPLTFQASVTPASVSNWLSVSTGIGTTSQGTAGSVSVTANPSKLTPGIYTAGVSFSLSATAVRTVNVTLIVTAPVGSQINGGVGPFDITSKTATCTGTALAPTQTGLVNNFSAPVAWPTPLSVVLADNCGALVTSGQIVATFSNGDPPLPLVLADPSRALYSGTWTPRSTSQQMTVVARATATGYPAATAQIVGSTLPNSAPLLTPHGTLHSFDPAVGASLAPGTIVQIYGQNLASLTVQPSAIPLPTSVNGTSVIIGGIAAPLYYVSPGQINAQLPFELNPLQPYQILVSANGALTTPDTVQVTPATPGLAAFTDGTLIAQHADGSLVSAGSPARSGEYLVAYLAGMGPTNAEPPSGGASPSSPLAQPMAAPKLTIDGIVSPIAFAGLTPGLVGLYQMNFQVPLGLAAGDLTLVVTQSGVPSNTTVLPYKP